MAYTRNPRPARGAEVLSLDELRRYLRLFWSDPEYGLAPVAGAFSAFIRACDVSAQHFRNIFLLEPPRQQFMGNDLQRRVSKAVLNVISGRIHYETDPKQVSRALGIYDPTGAPPGKIPPLRRDIQFTLRTTPYGPRLSRHAG